MHGRFVLCRAVQAPFQFRAPACRHDSCFLPPRQMVALATVEGKGVAMSLLDLLLLLLVAALCGSLGMAITGYSGGGCLMSVALGFIGALFGLWMARALSLPEIFMLEIGDVHFPVIWSIIGSALFIAVIGFLTRGLWRAN